MYGILFIPDLSQFYIWDNTCGHREHAFWLNIGNISDDRNDRWQKYPRPRGKRGTNHGQFDFEYDP